MGLKINKNGSYKDIGELYINNNGSYQYLDELYIKGTGKNILDSSLIENGYIIASTGNEGSDTTWRRSGYISIQGGKFYNFHMIAYSSSAGSAWYDSNKTYISGFSSNKYSGTYGIVQAPSNAVYLRVSYREASQTATSRMIEKCFQSENLIDTSALSSGYINKSTGQVESDVTWKYTDYISVHANSTYDFDIISYGLAGGCAWYTSNQTFISGFNGPLDSRIGIQIAPENASYLRVSFRIASQTSTSINAVEIIGNSPYVPYTNNPRIFDAGWPTTVSGPASFSLPDARAHSTDWEIDGNVSQSGTPSAASPIEVEGVGDKSRNLINIAGGHAIASGVLKTFTSEEIATYADTPLTLSIDFYNIDRSGTTGNCWAAYSEIDGTLSPGTWVNEQGGRSSKTFTIPSGATSASIRYSRNGSSVISCDYSNIQLEVGTNATPYIPQNKYDIAITAGTENLVNIASGSATVSKTLKNFTAEEITALGNSTYTYSVYCDNIVVSSSTITNTWYIFVIKNGTSINGNYIGPQGGVSKVTFDVDSSTTSLELKISRSSSNVTYCDYSKVALYKGTELPTTLHIRLDAPLYKIGTGTDSLTADGTRTTSIGHTVLSAGTSTISDAATNAPYYCSQQVNGTLSGTSITLDTGVTDADVYYVKATPATSTVEVIDISTIKGNNTVDITTDVAPSNATITYRKRTK